MAKQKRLLGHAAQPTRRHAKGQESFEFDGANMEIRVPGYVSLVEEHPKGKNKIGAAVGNKGAGTMRVHGYWVHAMAVKVPPINAPKRARVPQVPSICTSTFRQTFNRPAVGHAAFQRCEIALLMRSDEEG